jgi:hypothetical protein
MSLAPALVRLRKKIRQFVSPCDFLAPSDAFLIAGGASNDVAVASACIHQSPGMDQPEQTPVLGQMVGRQELNQRILLHAPGKSGGGQALR